MQFTGPGQSPFLLHWPETDWHRSLAAAIRDPELLLQRLDLSTDLLPAARDAAKLFPLLVPESYLNRMEKENPADPLLQQVLPIAAEQTTVPGFSIDAVGDGHAHRAPGLLQKYQGRALVITTGSCAIHCRYCFRRHYPYGEEPRRLEEWEAALQVLRDDTSLSEIILSGGDPLMLTDARFHDLISRLEAIPHLQRLRIHSRLPIVLPDRITLDWMSILHQTRLTPIMVVHANHANEVVADCADTLRLLVRSGITVLNQAVLLRGINDTVDAQHQLCERLVNLGVLPYYLHQLDRVSGTAHFEVEEACGREIIRELRKRLPGYAVPRYVREIAGEPQKTPLSE